jgi:hypothetical protein
MYALQRGTDMLMFEADPAHYQLCSVLGHCCESIATVHLARHLPSGTLVAVKKFNLEKSKQEASLIQASTVVSCCAPSQQWEYMLLN